MRHIDWKQFTRHTVWIRNSHWRTIKRQASASDDEDRARLTDLIDLGLSNYILDQLVELAVSITVDQNGTATLLRLVTAKSSPTSWLETPTNQNELAPLLANFTAKGPGSYPCPNDILKAARWDW